MSRVESAEQLLEKGLERPLFFGALHRGNAEAAAMLFGVETALVVSLRRRLEDQTTRSEVAGRLWRARRSRVSAPKLPKVRDACPVARSPREVLEEAQRRGDGLELLRGTSLEVAATLFGAHPEVVERARSLAARATPLE